jgi:hypothetical protein
VNNAVLVNAATIAGGKWLNNIDWLINCVREKSF